MVYIGKKFVFLNFHNMYLIEVIQDVELPDTGLKPHDAAVLLAHFIASEEFQTRLFRVNKRHTPQDWY